MDGVSSAEASPPGAGAYLPRLLDRKLRNTLLFSPAAVIEGPRGCGKTTPGSQAAAVFGINQQSAHTALTVAREDDGIAIVPLTALGP